MIKIEHLQKYFNRGKRSELHVLNDITLELPQTGLVCILGESGSGKTTLLNTIGGLDVFQGGTLTVDETILKKYEPKKIEHLRCEKFGYIFQNYYLLQDYTVAYNVKLALSHYDLTDEEKDERVSNSFVGQFILAAFNSIVCDSDLIFLISDTNSISSSVCISTLLNVTGYIILVFVKKIKN